MMCIPLCGIASEAPPPAATSPEVKVLVERAVPRAVLSGQSLKVTDGEGCTYECGKRVSVKASGENRFSVNRTSKHLRGPLRILAADGLIATDRGAFRGSIELIAPAGRRMKIINSVGLEEYLCGVVNAEVLSSWPIEAIKAQVVAARTYALRRMLDSGDLYHLTASTDDQVYRGRSIEDAVATRAVKDTAGWVITHHGQPITAYYHSCCGGGTDSAMDIKERDLPYTAPVKCRWCDDAPSFRWEFTIQPRELARLFKSSGRSITRPDKIGPKRVTQSGRILELEIISGRQRTVMSGEELRRIIGYQRLKSTRFSVERSDGGFRFRGTGHGHGIGACQWGMRRMAEKGHSWRAILRHYYKDVTFGRLRNRSTFDNTAAQF